MKLITVLLLALVSLVIAAGAPAQPTHCKQKPIAVVTFEKHVVDPVNFVFQGTTGGSANGALESRLVSLTVDGAIYHITFDWIVSAKKKHKSFVARTTGTWDTTTGRVVMDGEVTDGWHEGAPVHEEGQLIDPATLTFAGEIQILKGCGGR
jgi:hypothetical protein